MTKNELIMQTVHLRNEIAKLKAALSECVTSSGAVGMRDAGKMARKRFQAINEIAHRAGTE